MTLVSILAGILIAIITMLGDPRVLYRGSWRVASAHRREVRHYYDYPGGRGYVVVDCETDMHVYEGGLDKRSSLGSVQQALFFAHLTGKVPAVVIYDTDGVVGKYEYRIGSVCEHVGVGYISYP